MLKRLDKLKIQNKIKCELYIYKHKKNLTVNYIVILEKCFKKLFSGKKKKLNDLSTCIKNSLKWTNRYKLIKYFKNIYNYIYIYIYIN